MGIGSLPSLSEIELVRSILCLLSCHMALSDGRFQIIFFFEYFDTITGACTRKIYQMKQYGGFELIQCLPTCL